MKRVAWVFAGVLAVSPAVWGQGTTGSSGSTMDQSGTGTGGSTTDQGSMGTSGTSTGTMSGTSGSTTDQGSMGTSGTSTGTMSGTGSSTMDHGSMGSSGTTTGTMSSGTMDAGSMHTLFSQLDDEIDKLQKRVLNEDQDPKVARDGVATQRVRRFEEQVKKLEKSTEAAAATLPTRDDVNELARSYIDVMNAVSWLQRANVAVKDLLPVHRLMDQIVAQYGGYHSLDLPDKEIDFDQASVHDEDVDYEVKGASSDVKVENKAKEID